MKSSSEPNEMLDSVRLEVSDMSQTISSSDDVSWPSEAGCDTEESVESEWEMLESMSKDDANEEAVSVGDLGNERAMRGSDGGRVP